MKLLPQRELLLAFAIAPLLLTPVMAQGPAGSEAARAERQTILQAADKLKMLQTRTEKLEVTVERLNEMVAQMKVDALDLNKTNETLVKEMAALKEALKKSEEARAKERKVLLDEISKLIASNSSTPASPPAANTPNNGDPTQVSPSKEPDNFDTTNSKQVGFYHTVEAGQTLWLIAKAYRDAGINVSVERIQQANQLSGSTIVVGQKLFIPKD